jgi:osmotically-inducible protein OsmY
MSAGNVRSMHRTALQRRLAQAGMRLTHGVDGWVIDGDAACYDAKRDAGRTAAEILACPVVNRVRVVPLSRTGDAELLASVRRALAIGGIEISITVRNGIVTLRGKIASAAARRRAERMAWAARGVVDVRNTLKVEADEPYQRAG